MKRRAKRQPFYDYLTKTRKKQSDLNRINLAQSTTIKPKVLMVFQEFESEDCPNQIRNAELFNTQGEAFDRIS